MFKRFVAAFLLSFVGVAFSYADAPAYNFNNMQPTVKVVSYKKTYTGQMVGVSSGSGTVISDTGLILTNHHVIFDDNEFKPFDAFEICLTFDVQKEPVCEYTARLIDSDKDLDVALLRFNQRDIFGNEVPKTLNHLSHRLGQTPKDRDTVLVLGYPGSGGASITVTRGQISGAEKQNNYQYFKTDTDFDSGSSGGTVLNENGDFIGIPTYIRSNNETVGFFLDLKEARSWIDKRVNQLGTTNAEANAFLKQTMKRLASANKDLTYTQEAYPYLKADLPDGWKFLAIHDDRFVAYEANVSDPAVVIVYTLEHPYKVDAGVMEELNNDLDDLRRQYTDYKKETVDYLGVEAWKVTYTSSQAEHTTYYIPYGYNLVIVNYSVDIDEKDEQQAKLKPVLQSLELTKEPVDEPNFPKTISFNEPPFQLTVPNNWAIRKSNSQSPRSLLAEGAIYNNYKGYFNIFYNPIDKGERHLTPAQRLNEITKLNDNAKIVSKNESISLGGLEGFSYTYEYEGDEFQEIRKSLQIVLHNGNYEFTFDYDDVIDNFDRNLPVVEQMMQTFAFDGQSSGATSEPAEAPTNPAEPVEETTAPVTEPAQPEAPRFGQRFIDLQYHRFATAINQLADKGIVSGNRLNQFKPEDRIGRGEALQWILDSKNHLESERGSNKVIDLDAYRNRSNDEVNDVPRGASYYPHVQYALEQGIVSGYSNQTYRPNRPIRLVEALKMIIEVYDIPVWAGDTNPWFKKYMEKGFELRLIPYGMYDPMQELTRAELAHLIYTVYDDAK